MPHNIVSYEDWRINMYSDIDASSYKNSVFGSGKDWFWVIDGSAHPDLPGLLWNLASDPNATPLLMNTYAEAATRKGPWFLPCIVHSPDTDWIFEQLPKIPLGVLLSIEKGGGSQLFDHLQNIVECSFLHSDDMAGTQKKSGIFRFYDARVLYGLATCHNQTFLSLVKGPALSIHTWEPGRAMPVVCNFTAEDKTFRSEPIDLPKDIIDHLWQENIVHSIIGSLGGIAGETLRALKISDAYEYVSAIRFLMEGTTYDTRQDVGFATAYAMLSPTDSWKSLIEYIKIKKMFQYPLLSDAYTQASKYTGVY